MNWSELPDLVAVALLACAFASVARRGQTPVSGLWLTGWMLIVLHFLAFMFLSAPGWRGILAEDTGLVALADAGVLFMYAAVPYRDEILSRLMFLSLLGTNTLYIYLINARPASDWTLDSAAVLVGALPLTVAIVSLRKTNHMLRWMVVSLYCALSTFLLIVQHRPGDGGELALNGVLFAVYFGCALLFWYTYGRATAGAFITIAGFFAWASVFVVAPWMGTFLPSFHIEDEVWNLPKYVVAVGMILLLLEDQIEHNKYLALHDELTGLPNRRLFLDRLTVALDHARRTSSRTALLVVDLDQFKQVNDTLGHHVGDRLLQQVGAIFTGRVRHSDTVARTGGDEFSVILEGTSSRESAGNVADSLLQLLNEPMQVDEHAVRVGASIGVALFPDDAADMEALCIAADHHMYNEKRLSKEIDMRSTHERSALHPVFAAQANADFCVARDRPRH
ncbi:MAG: GGDEF domain-containing protein [Terracidiphilus sp.]